MTLEELKQKEKELQTKHDAEIKALRKEFAFSNNTISPGDIVFSSKNTIKVETVKFTNEREPTCVYVGTQLKKDLTPAKRQLDTKIWQSYVTKVIKAQKS